MGEIRGIDLDEVLFETVDEVLKFHNYTLNGVPMTKSDITDYHFSRMQKLKMDKETGVKYFHDFLRSDKVHDIQPIADAKKALEKLKTQDKLLIAITGRLSEYESWTKAALQNHYRGLISDIIFLNAYSDLSSSNITQRTKSQICKELGATVMVEDDLHYAQELADNGIKVYLLAKPWNQQYRNGMHPDIIKISSWKELMRYENR